MALQSVLDTLDGLDATFQEHYKKDDKTGKFVLELTDAGNFPQIRDLKNEAAQSRIKLRETEGSLLAYRGLGELAEVQAKLDKIPELEATATGKLDEAKIETIVKARLTPVERQLADAQKAIADRDTELGAYKTKDTKRTISDKIREAGTKTSIRPEALEDALLLAGVQFEVGDDGETIATKDGLDPVTWLQDRQKDRPHWWGDSLGGGASGSGKPGFGGTNPFTAEHWNMTEQGKLVNTNRPEAERMAKAAGTSIGGAQPPARAK